MTLAEAKAECERWFTHLGHQKDKAAALQKLAGDRRTGQCDEQEGRRRLLGIQESNPTVYDGANLHDAVKVLLKHCS